MKKRIPFALALLLPLLLLGCSQRKTADERRVITVTIEPLRYFAERIAGDKFDIRTMVPSGANPETYEPTAQQMVELAESDLYVKVGSIGFERTWMKRLETNAPHAIVIDSSTGITLAQSADGIVDPHTWMSAANAAIISTNICKALTNIDHRDSLYFKQNLARLLSDIAHVDEEVKLTLEHAKSRTFLIYHPILTYFARDYGLTQIPMEQEGREPSAAQLQEVITQARRQGAQVFFVQKEFGEHNVEIVAKSSGTKKQTINPLGYDWAKEMKNIATSLK